MRYVLSSVDVRRRPGGLGIRVRTRTRRALFMRPDHPRNRGEWLRPERCPRVRAQGLRSGQPAFPTSRAATHGRHRSPPCGEARIACRLGYGPGSIGDAGTHAHAANHCSSFSTLPGQPPVMPAICLRNMASASGRCCTWQRRRPARTLRRSRARSFPALQQCARVDAAGCLSSPAGRVPGVLMRCKSGQRHHGRIRAAEAATRGARGRPKARAGTA